jgi:hypothetical protein
MTPLKTIPEMAKDLKRLICYLPQHSRSHYFRLFSQVKKLSLLIGVPPPTTTALEFMVRVAIINYITNVIEDDITLQQVAIYMTSLTTDTM